jgi:hypothetical protein
MQVQAAKFMIVGRVRFRNFAESTICPYAYDVEHSSQYLHLRPDQLGPIPPQKVAGMMARSFLKSRVAHLSFRDESNPINFRVRVGSF